MKEAIVEQVNLMLKAYLSPESHLNSMLDELRSFTRPRAVLFPCNNPASHPELFDKDNERTAVGTNFHRHSQTCHKGTIGRLFCRLGLPRCLLNETGVEYLIPRRDPTTKKVTYDIVELPLPPPTNSLSMRDFSTDPVRKRDPNIAYWDVERPLMEFPGFMDIDTLNEEFQDTLSDFPPENADQEYAARIRDLTERFGKQLTEEQAHTEWLRLKSELEKLTHDEWKRLSSAFPTRNGLIVEYSPAVTALLGCNTNLSFLGSDAQAKATICYILKYITKPPAELSHTLALLYKARQTIQTFPSVAPDSGAPMRTTQHYLNRIVNQTTSAQEVSAEMAASKLLQMTSEVCTHGFITVQVSSAIGYAIDNPILERDGLDEFRDLDSEENENDHETAVETQQRTASSSDDIGSDGEPNLISMTENEEEEPYMLDWPEASGPLDTGDIFAPIGVYQLKDKVAAVADHENYAFRGPHLRHLSLYEWKSIIVVKPKPAEKKKTATEKSAAIDLAEYIAATESLETEEIVQLPSTTSDDTGGRPDNGCFPFDNGHQLFATHFQQLRSKHKIPVLIRLPPKNPPSKPAELTDRWMKQARHFAEYYLTLFRPWTCIHPSGQGTHPGILNWHALCVFMRDLEFGSDGCSPTVVQSIVKRWIEQQAQGMRVTAEERTTVRMRRNINATPWGRSDGSEPLRVHHNNSQLQNQETGETAEERARIEVDLLRQLLSADDAFTRSNAKELMYLQYTLDALGNVTPTTTTSHPSPLIVESASKLLHLYQHSPNSIDDILQRLKNEDLDLEDLENQKTETNPVLPDDQPQLNVLPSRNDLNEQQELILEILLKTLRHRAPAALGGRTDSLASEQALLFAHGAPGTGKTFLARCIVKELTNLGLDTYCIASTGNASGNLPKGRTIHNGLGIPCEQPNDQFCSKLLDDRLCKLQKRIKQKSVALVIIDEISCVTAAMLAHIDQRLQQIMGCYDKPFGGLSVLVMGDMFQLPPVKGKAIYKEIVEYALQTKESPGKKKKQLPDANNPSFTGTLLFQQFKLVELTQQMRAAEDVEHTKFLKQMRYPKSNKPRIPANLPTRFKTLTKDDMLSDPLFITAPILVQKNVERHNINKFKSKSFALQQQQPRFSWRTELAGRTSLQKEGEPNLATLDEHYYKQFPSLTNYFVKNAPGYLIENINPSLGLANGTKIIYESLVLDPRDDPVTISQRLSTEINPDIVLQYPPLFVIVSVPEADPKRFIDTTLVEGSVVIPVATVQRNKFVNVPRRRGERPFKVWYTPHNCELGFAVTVHKIQGQTLERVIIDLNYRPFQPQFNFHALMVAVSRVRASNHIRILPLQPSSPSLDYLLTVKPDQSLLIWLQGYKKENENEASTWSVEKAQTALNALDNITPPARKKTATKSTSVTALQSFAQFQQSRKQVHYIDPFKNI